MDYSKSNVMTLEGRRWNGRNNLISINREHSKTFTFSLGFSFCLFIDAIFLHCNQSSGNPHAKAHRQIV